MGELLGECLKAAAAAAAQQSIQPTEADRQNYCSCRGQTQDGAIWSVFIGAWESQIGVWVGIKDMEVELFSHKLHTCGLCLELGTKTLFTNGQ